MAFVLSSNQPQSLQEGWRGFVLSSNCGSAACGILSACILRGCNFGVYACGRKRPVFGIAACGALVGRGRGRGAVRGIAARGVLGGGVGAVRGVAAQSVFGGGVGAIRGIAVRGVLGGRDGAVRGVAVVSSAKASVLPPFVAAPPVLLPCVV